MQEVARQGGKWAGTSPKGRREGKNILDHDAERVTWQKREKIPEDES